MRTARLSRNIFFFPRATRFFESNRSGKWYVIAKNPDRLFPSLSTSVRNDRKTFKKKTSDKTSACVKVSDKFETTE